VVSLLDSLLPPLAAKGLIVRITLVLDIQAIFFLLYFPYVLYRKMEY